jgi:hypothetical protein
MLQRTDMIWVQQLTQVHILLLHQDKQQTHLGQLFILEQLAMLQIQILEVGSVQTDHL